MQQFTDIYEALRNGADRYTMTRPCRRGHMGERYSRNGLCITCAKINQTERNEKKRREAIASNTEKFEPAKIVKVVAKPAVHQYLKECAAIFEYGSEQQRLMMVEAITAIGKVVASDLPARARGELNLAALTSIADLTADRLCYVDGMALIQAQDDDGNWLMRVGGWWYRIDALKLLWDGVSATIQPYGEVTE